MKSDEIESELSQLRAEVAALSKARRMQQKAAEEEAETAAGGNGAQSDGAAATFDFDVKGQVEELVDLLETEMRDSPLVTGLAIFAAGVLVGRIIR
jgi:hypothetical protein